MQLLTVALYPEAGLLAVVPPSWQADLLGVEAGSPFGPQSPAGFRRILLGYSSHTGVCLFSQ